MDNTRLSEDASHPSRAASTILSKVRRLFHRAPDFIIGASESPYMRRWWIIPRNRYFNIYLHNILRNDDDRALHDHPWINLSILLRGRYLELMPVATEYGPGMVGKWRGIGSMVLRRPTAAHRLELDDGKPCWSLFITGPNVRTWGFHCPKGWVPWWQFCAVGDSSQVGRGCGEVDAAVVPEEQGEAQRSTPPNA